MEIRILRNDFSFESHNKIFIFHLFIHDILNVNRIVLHYAYFNHQDIETSFSLYKILLLSIFEMSCNILLN